MAEHLDPVSRAAVDPAGAIEREFNGHRWFLESDDTAAVFDRDPSVYVTKCGHLKNLEAPPVNETAKPKPGQYYCPMCPGVISDVPSTCPICGMALDRVPGGTGDGGNPELEDMSRRLGFALIFTVPLFIFTMGPMVIGSLAEIFALSWGQWLEFALASPVVLWAGWPFFVRGAQSLRSGHYNMFTLIAIGTGAAYLYSTVAAAAPGIFPDDFRMADGRVALYFESAAVITCLVIVGQVLELRARSRTSKAIEALLGLAPDTARRIADDGSESDVPVDEIAVGDVLRVRPGERIAVDGLVREGNSRVEESMITGEDRDVPKWPGDPLTGGTINKTGAMVMVAERIGADTVLARIVTMVGEAQRSRAPIQRIADTVSGYFVPAVVLSAVLAFVAWAVFGPPPSLALGLVHAVAVLIIACPCALGLATPMSITVATARAAAAGVLIKNAEALETLGRVDTVVFDKTGTLTTGTPRVVDLRVAEGVDEDDIWRVLLAIERTSEHPIAAAVVEAAVRRETPSVTATSVQATPGYGISGEVDGVVVAVGNRAYLSELEIPQSGWLDTEVASINDMTAAPICVAVGGQAAAVVAIARPDDDGAGWEGAREIVSSLEARGVSVIMLTGDTEARAQEDAAVIGIKNVIAEVRPEDKRDCIADLQAKGHVVAMAGDGVNDAPALALADVGIAMGNGTDVAIESASVTLVKGDLRGIDRAWQLSRATMRNIRQNLFFAFVYNGLGVPIAAGVLYPLLGWRISPMFAALAMSLSSVSVISNSLRLRNIRL